MVMGATSTELCPEFDAKPAAMIHVAAVVIVMQLSMTMLGCVSYGQMMAPMKDAIVAGDHGRAHTLLDKQQNLSQRGKNRLLYRLEKASIYHYEGQLKAAEREYKAAARLATELYTKSMSQGVMSWMVNDNTMDYVGEDYEIIGIHTMMAILYLELGELTKAAVEARRINTRLRELGRDQAREENVPGIRYERDAFALYLSGLVFEATGKVDHAIIDFTKALESYHQGYPGGSTPPGLVQSLYRLAKQRGRSSILTKLAAEHSHEVAALDASASGAGIVVIAKGYPTVGKDSQSFVFHAPHGFIRYAWPVIPAGSPAMPPYVFQLKHASAQPLHVDSGRRADAAAGRIPMIQDYDDLARVILEDRRAGLTAKALSRIVAKGAVAYGLMNSESSAMVLLGMLLSLSSLFTETADTRSWNLLPGGFGLKRYFLQPNQSYQLSYVSPHGQHSTYAFVQDERLRFVVLDYSRDELVISEPFD